MTDQLGALGIRIFTTCPPSRGASSSAYMRDLTRVARWSERAGCDGILIYSDNATIDPWLVAQVIVGTTKALTPLVAVQPAYMHPFAVARIVSAIGLLYGRGVHLNMVAGGFVNDLTALADPTPHDERYARLTEYTQIVMSLLTSCAPVTLRGRYYQVTNLRVVPPLEAALLPRVFVSGSSPAGGAAAEQLGALAVRYPAPAESVEDDRPKGTFGIRVGIVTRERATEAWKVARRRFPPDRRGEVAHRLAMKVSDSGWHGQLSAIAGALPADDDNPYWMVPFENYKTFCPYLVGSYDRVADEVSRYLALGCRTIILDIPHDERELRHILVALARAADRTPP